MKSAFKERAIELRKCGKTYSEILQTVPVAKSTLSLWFRSVDLASQQKQAITQKRIDGQLRGALARREARLREVQVSVEKGRVAVSSLSKRELWLIGIALYWAEGNKQNLRSPSAGINMCNSDVRMIAVFRHWLTLLEVPDSDIYYELYIHESRKSETVTFAAWWEIGLGLSPGEIQRIYFKKGNRKTNRTNTGDLYHGLLRIRVKASTSLNRRLHGWISGIVAALGGGVIGNTSAFGAEDSRFEP
jgi:hypothetical protein